MKASSRQILLLTIGVTALIALLWPPQRLSVTESCNPDGTVSRVKALVQGRRWWRYQLGFLDLEIQRCKDEPARHARIRADVEALKTQTRQTMEGLYKEHPELRPSPEQRAADELRAQADALEQAELEEFIEKARVKELEWLSACRPQIQAMAAQ